MQNISNNHLARSKNEYKPKIIIFGVGGAGGNAINNMISSDLKGWSLLLLILMLSLLKIH